MSKRKGNAAWRDLKKEYWGQNVIVDTQEWGCIDFSPQGMKEVFGGEKLTYEEYLDAQMATGRDIRGWFFLCHHEVALGFAGQIERITQKNPSEIRKIDSYKLPSDDDLIRQGVDQIICEACMFRDHCYGGMCIANKGWLDGMRKSMFDAVKCSR